MADIFDAPNDDMLETFCCMNPGCKGHVQFSRKKYDTGAYSRFDNWGPEACDVCAFLHTRYYDIQYSSEYSGIWHCPYVELFIS